MPPRRCNSGGRRAKSASQAPPSPQNSKQVPRAPRAESASGWHSAVGIPGLCTKAAILGEAGAARWRCLYSPFFLPAPPSGVGFIQKNHIPGLCLPECDSMIICPSRLPAQQESIMTQGLSAKPPIFLPRPSGHTRRIEALQDGSKEAALFPQFALPLFQQASRRKKQCPAHSSSGQEPSQDQDRFNGLPQAHFVTQQSPFGPGPGRLHHHPSLVRPRAPPGRADPA